MIKAIFFDAAGTLIHLPKSVGWHYRTVALRHGLDCDEEKMNAAFRAAWKRMPSRPALRRARADDDKGWWRELVGRVLNDCDVPHTFECDAFFKELYAHFTEPGVWALFPEIEHVLAQLGERFRLGVISNFDGRLRMILDQLGIAQRFEFIAISSEIGADKPDAFIFQTAMEKLKVSPNESLHVGDDPARDWHAAESAGMRSFRLDRPKNSLAELPEFLKSLG